ncbi:MAG: CCA tRNA nucleotidyltransferase [Sporolactobacillus sp.]
MIFPFGDAADILDRLTAKGFQAYAVGGAVRDFLLRRPIHDVDIATSARPEEVVDLFRHTVPIGIKHGTVAVLYKEKSYEVTTFRSEQGYDDFRHPTTVVFERTLEKDLMRRDYTMNALAMDRQGKIIDLFGGQSDLAVKRIRMVGNPEERITEDPLRIMRGIRFASELGFSLGEAEQTAFQRKARLLKKISMERIDQEMTKFLAGKWFSAAIDLLYGTGCTRYLPILSERKEVSALQTIQMEHGTSDAERWAIFLSVLGIHDIGTFSQAWKWSAARKNAVRQMLTWLESRRSADWERWTVYNAGPNLALSIERLRCALGESSESQYVQSEQKISHFWQACPIHSRHELQANGDDFAAWAAEKPGPWLAGVLRSAEQSVVSGQLPNERETIESWFREWRKTQKTPS